MTMSVFVGEAGWDVSWEVTFDDLERGRWRGRGRREKGEERRVKARGKGKREEGGGKCGQNSVCFTNVIFG